MDWGLGTNINQIYQNLTFYLYDADNITNIPKKSGLYYWYYYKNLYRFVEDSSGFWKILEEYYSKNIPNISSSFHNFKISVTASESFFEDKRREQRLFGLSEKKLELFKDFILENVNNRIYFNNYLKYIMFQKPFYVGKADNLRSRLNQHINGKTKLLKLFEENNFEEDSIWIGYIELQDTFKEEVNSVFEEITQRILKPGLVERPG